MRNAITDFNNHSLVQIKALLPDFCQKGMRTACINQLDFVGQGLKAKDLDISRAERTLAVVYDHYSPGVIHVPYIDWSEVPQTVALLSILTCRNPLFWRILLGRVARIPEVQYFLMKWNQIKERNKHEWIEIELNIE